MILLTYDQRERLIRASSKSNFTPKEDLNTVIEQIMMRSPYAFKEKAVKDLYRRINMNRYHGFANIDS